MNINKTYNQEQNLYYAGTGSRIPEYDANGLKTVTREIIEGKLADGIAIGNLVNPSNWNSITNQYTGTLITGTYEGQYYYDFNYYYYAYYDNTWIRIPIDFTTLSTTDLQFGTGISIYKDIYDNLVFEDPNAGIYTLSELAAGSGGTGYTEIVSLSSSTLLDITYKDKIIEASGTITITLPDGMLTGFRLDIVNVGAGVITLAAQTTLQTASSAVTIATQYGGASIYNRGSNIWLATGDLV